MKLMSMMLIVSVASAASRPPTSSSAGVVERCERGIRTLLALKEKVPPTSLTDIDETIHDLVDIIADAGGDAAAPALFRISSYRMGEYTATAAFCDFVNVARRSRWPVDRHLSDPNACMKATDNYEAICLSREEYEQTKKQLIAEVKSNRKCEIEK